MEHTHVCPWWFAYAFDNPLRQVIHKPEQMFDGLVKEGQTVVDIGCGMGHFSLGLARMVGESGRLIAVDLQVEMLERVRRRAERAGLANRVELRQARAESIGITEKVDFALAFWMVHEIPDKAAFFKQVLGILKPEGRLLVAEPKIHVTGSAVERMVEIAHEVGLRACGEPRVRLSQAVLFAR